MTHGHELHERWNGTGKPPVRHSPPFVGAPALEVTHPFHFKMAPSMLLGPICNHDLNCFLRLPNVPDDVQSYSEVVNAMLDAMGDHEYYSASYASKEEPHMEGLLHTLVDGLRRKEMEIRELRASGDDFTPQDIARKILHRLIACTNRRMHKGFPEMLTYLLRKPMEYASHDFVHCIVHPFIKQVFRCVHCMVAAKGGWCRWSSSFIYVRCHGGGHRPRGRRSEYSSAPHGCQAESVPGGVRLSVQEQKA